MPRTTTPDVPCANPLFLSWVGEWMEKLKERNTKGYQIYKRAYDSIKQCPIAYDHPCELIRLNGIGDIIAKRLEDKLRVYCTSQGLPMPEKPGHTHAQDEDVAQGAAQTTKAGTKRRGPARQYLPKYRSGGWAILRALDTFPPDASVTKAEIIRVAHGYCDSSFDTPLDNKYYTAWNSIKTLLETGYVYKSGNPPRYCLTEEGAEIARTIAAADENANKPADAPFQKRSRPEVSASNAYIHPETLLAPGENIAPVPWRGTPGLTVSSTFTGSAGTSSCKGHTLRPGSYTIQLVMDNRELHSQVDRDRLEREIGEAGIEYTVRALDVGDALWIAKSGGEEYVLDYIVERKRMDDLVQSITGGRFHEQKFRLMKSGMRHVIYIIEDYVGFDRPEFIEAIQTAISSSQTVNNFFVKRVKNIQETIGYLQRMSKFLTKLHRNRTLTIIPESQISARTFYSLKGSLARPNTYHCISYETFGAIASKSASLNIGDVFLKMLMSIKGVSAEKAIEIQKHFPTLNDLIKTYEGVDEREGKLIIAERCAKYGRRKIGNVLSGKIYEVFKAS